MKWISVINEKKELRISLDDFKTDPRFDRLSRIVIPTERYTKRELFELLSICYRRLSQGGQILLNKPKWFQQTTLVGESNEDALEKFFNTKREWSAEQISERLLFRLLKIQGFLTSFETDGLIIGQKDEDPSSNALPLVTIAIPAYKSDFFEYSLLSAMGQSYPRKIILVADEGVDSRVFEIYKNLTQQYPHVNVKYIRHERPLGELANFEFCRAQAEGKYLKYLNDDDILDPDCVQRFVRYMEAFEDSVTLIASRRNVVDCENVELFVSPLKPFEPMFLEDVYVFGRDVIEYCLNVNMNQLGEPSVVMFRIKDTDLQLTRINDPDYPCSYDMVLNFKLLLKGNLIYLAEPLSLFRIHPKQASGEHKASLRSYCVWTNMILAMKKAGCFSNLGEYKMALERAKGLQIGAVENFQQPEEKDALLQAVKPLDDELNKLEVVEAKPKVIQNAFSLTLN